jgi:hypothetical protein
MNEQLTLHTLPPDSHLFTRSLAIGGVNEASISFPDPSTHEFENPFHYLTITWFTKSNKSSFKPVTFT